MSDAKIAYLELLHERQVIFDKMIACAQELYDCGTEGVQEVASERPDLILSVISELMLCISHQRQEHLSFVEHHFRIQDRIDSIINRINE